jgi:hypothetical protein
MSYHNITKDLYPHPHDYLPSLSQHIQVLLIKHHLHFTCVEVCEQKFQIIRLPACTITLNIPPQIAVTKQWGYVGVWLYFKITHHFCGLYNMFLLFCFWGWQLSWCSSRCWISIWQICHVKGSTKRHPVSSNHLLRFFIWKLYSEYKNFSFRIFFPRMTASPNKDTLWRALKLVLTECLWILAQNPSNDVTVT